MKLILGDNQFFGINHVDIKKAESVKEKFNNPSEIEDFIKESINCGMDGFMMNSNSFGFQVVDNFDFQSNKVECHYSVPYPHKYAGIVNESGMVSLLIYIIKQLNFTDLFRIIKFIFTFNLIHLIPLVLRMEIPRNLPRGSVVYLQNVVTDLVLGLKNGEIFIREYIKVLEKMGYQPGLITLNPAFVFNKLMNSQKETNLYLCININNSGFNVFPSPAVVETIIEKIKSDTEWTLMGMSIFSSGQRDVSVEQSIEYIKNLKLDYVVFGSSKISNIRSNISSFNSTKYN